MLEVAYDVDGGEAVQEGWRDFLCVVCGVDGTANFVATKPVHHREILLSGGENTAGRAEIAGGWGG